MSKLELYVPTSSERKSIDEMFAAFDALRREGWQDVMYAPIGRDLWLIEAGSTGFHHGRREEDRTFWVADSHDTYPCDPILFKLQNERPS